MPTSQLVANNLINLCFRIQTMLSDLQQKELKTKIIENIKNTTKLCNLRCSPLPPCQTCQCCPNRPCKPKCPPPVCCPPPERCQTPPPKCCPPIKVNPPKKCCPPKMEDCNGFKVAQTFLLFVNLKHNKLFSRQRVAAKNPKNQQCACAGPPNIACAVT